MKAGMSDKDSLGDRMKEYEEVPRARLVRRTPVLMRLDGKAFHTFTRGMPRPYHRPFHECMWAAAKHLCENIQGVQLAYVQSDEITLLLTDYADIKTEAWFDYQVQKMCSVAAAMCSVAFMREYFKRFESGCYSPGDVEESLDHMKLPTFDARVWNLPKEEVVNCFIWRQLDATRNAIQMVGQANFSHKQLHSKSCNDIQEMLFQEKHINFNDSPVPQKRGVCVRKEIYQHIVEQGVWGHPNPKDDTPSRAVERTRWVVDEDIPDFRKDRSYVYRFVDQTGPASSDACPSAL